MCPQIISLILSLSAFAQTPYLDKLSYMILLEYTIHIFACGPLTRNSLPTFLCFLSCPSVVGDNGVVCPSHRSGFLVSYLIAIVWIRSWHQIQAVQITVSPKNLELRPKVSICPHGQTWVTMGAMGWLSDP